MDERIRKSNDILFIAPMAFFAASNLLCMVMIFNKQPQSNIVIYVISYFYFLHVSLSTIPVKKLRCVMHWGSFNGWKNLHSALAASWVYSSCVSVKDRGEGLSVLSCLCLGFMPSAVVYSMNYFYFLKLVKNEIYLSEILTHTREVLFTYHTNFTKTKDGSSSAEIAISKMKSIINAENSWKGYKPQFGPKNILVTIVICLFNIAFSMTMFKNKFYERLISCLSTILMSLNTVLVHTMHVPDIEYGSLSGNVRSYAVSLASMVASLICSWIIYYLTLNPFVTAASAFHFVDAISNTATKLGTIADVMHASLVLIISIMITI